MQQIRMYLKPRGLTAITVYRDQLPRHVIEWRSNEPRLRCLSRISPRWNTFGRMGGPAFPLPSALETRP